MREDAPAAGAADRLLVVGVVRKPHGVRGELQVALETDRPSAVFRRGRVLQLGDASGRPDGASVTVEASRPIKDGLLLRLGGVADRSAAEPLRGRTLLIAASEAAPAAADEIPYHRLVGCTVRVRGEAIGTVAEVLELGGGQTLAVRRPRGPEILIPFARDFVRSLDVANGELEMDTPEGLLEL